MSVLQEVSENVKNIKPMDYYVLARRASQITEDLRQVKGTMLLTYLQCGFESPFSNLCDIWNLCFKFCL